MRKFAHETFPVSRASDFSKDLSSLPMWKNRLGLYSFEPKPLTSPLYHTQNLFDDLAWGLTTDVKTSLKVYVAIKPPETSFHELHFLQSTLTVWHWLQGQDIFPFEGLLHGVLPTNWELDKVCIVRTQSGDSSTAYIYKSPSSSTLPYKPFFFSSTLFFFYSAALCIQHSLNSQVC